MPAPLLFLLTVAIWGTTWIAVKMQATAVAPELSVAYRFLAASAILLAWMAWRRKRLRWPAAAHLRMAAQGACLFGLNYIPVYWASRYLTSGLVALAFSTAVVFGILFGVVADRRPIEARLAVGAALGLAGLALFFRDELAALSLAGETSLAILAVVAGAAVAAAGMVLGSVNQKAGLPVLPLSAFGMLYGGLLSAGWAAASGRGLAWDPSPAFAISLAYLVLVGSIAGFWCFLTLVGRIGPQRAGYVPVLFPVVALAISTVFEGYAWDWSGVAGAVLVVAGNLVVMLPRAGKVPPRGIWSRLLTIGGIGRVQWAGPACPGRRRE
ncbi:DMT family transporter [Stella sp.]|uniref:DMT family transporter n=1 Tax=Stella sp. TaxID=2912054 RepID=UPI0035B4423C